MRRGLALTILALAVALIVAATAHAQVVVFEAYDTTASVRDNVIHIERDVRLKNIGKSPIIPGELHFRLYERRGGEKRPLAVEGFTAKTGRGESLETRVEERKGETDLSVQLWNPLLPGFHTDFTLEYDLEFEPSGILFYEIRLPQEETTIPISSEQTRFMIDDKYHVTYAPGSVVSSLSGNTVVDWEDAEAARVVEYSRLPLPRTGIRAVNVFWLVIILALLGAFFLSVRRQRGRPTQSQQGWQQQGPQGWQQQPQQGWQQYPPGGHG